MVHLLPPLQSLTTSVGTPHDADVRCRTAFGYRLRSEVRRRGYARGVMDTSPAVFPFRARLLLFVGLVVVAAYALPVSAAAVEAVSNRAENWIVVAYLALVVLFGAMVGALVPRSSTARTRRGRALRWAGAGLLAAFIAYAVWLLLLAG